MGMHYQSADADVGVIIVSYNTRSLLYDCLVSLRRCALPLAIHVVDNASSDDSVAMVRATFPEVTLHAMATNLGFAAANNVGIAAVLSPAPPTPPPPYLLLLNPDTIVPPGAIETLVAFLQAHPRVGLVSPRLLNADGTIQPAAFRFPTLAMSVLDVFPPGEVLPGRLYGSWWQGRYPQEAQQVPAPFPIDHPLGACMLARRETVAEIGGLRTQYFMYSEEIDWCWRIRAAGWAIWQVPDARVTHIGGAATSQFRHRMLVELHRSRVQFFRTHYAAGFLRLHRLITVAGMLRATLVAWRRYAQGHMTRQELRARLWAYGHIVRLR